jgi:ribosome-associated protein
MNIEAKIAAIVAALEDVKSEQITVLDTRRLSPLFERMVIASAQSTRQTRALADHVVKKLLELGERARDIEGGRSGEWVLVDLGDVVVHVMQPAVRAHYNLEELWGELHAPRAA